MYFRSLNIHRNLNMASESREQILGDFMVNIFIERIHFCFLIDYLS